MLRVRRCSMRTPPCTIVYGLSQTFEASPGGYRRVRIPCACACACAFVCRKHIIRACLPDTRVLWCFCHQVYASGTTTRRLKNGDFDQRETHTTTRTFVPHGHLDGESGIVIGFFFFVFLVYCFPTSVSGRSMRFGTLR